MEIPFLHRKKKSPDGYLHVSKIEWSPDTGLQVVAKHPDFVAFIADVVTMFYDAGAINYFSMSAYHPKAGEIEIIVKRKDGKSQTQIIDELRAELAGK